MVMPLGRGRLEEGKGSPGCRLDNPPPREPMLPLFSSDWAVVCFCRGIPHGLPLLIFLLKCTLHVEVELPLLLHPLLLHVTYYSFVHCLFAKDKRVS